MVYDKFTAAKKIDVTKELTDEQKTLSGKVNHVSSRLYQQYAAAKESKNFTFFTPNLIAIFSLIYAGAPESLKKAFAGEFLIDQQFPEEKWHTELENYHRSLENRAEKSEETSSMFSNLFTKNITPKLTYQSNQAVALRNDTSLNENFYYKDKLEVIPFNNSQDAATNSNAWVEKNTEGKIKDLVKDLDPQTVLIFIATSIFGGKWVYPFNTTATQKSRFYNADGSIVSVDMMWQGNNNIRHGGYKGCEILELPFHGDVTMIIAKPNKPYHHEGAFNYEAPMNTLMEEENLKGLLDYTFSDQFKTKRGLGISVPKFASEDEINLTGDMKDWELVEQIMGADLSGSLCTVRDNEQPIKVQKIVSRTLFKMEEEGVKLIAASYSPSHCESCDPTCTINRPFLYLFYDKHTKTILGCGRVLNLEGPKTKEFSRY